MSTSCKNESDRIWIFPVSDNMVLKLFLHSIYSFIDRVQLYFENKYSNNKYISYGKFVISYVVKAHFVPVLLQVFIMNFTIEFMMRYSQMRLYAINEENHENELFYILFFIFVLLIHNIYQRYKDKFDIKNQKSIEGIFEKDIFIQKAKIPFSLRQKIDMDKLNYLRDDVSRDLVDMINSYFESFAKIFTNIILSIKIFYENKMIYHYVMMTITFFLVTKYYFYPMKKNNIKIREEYIQKRKVVFNQLNLVIFYFIPFVENIYMYDILYEKEMEIHDICVNMKNMSKNLLAIIYYLGDFFTMIIFFTNYSKNIRNYYIIVTTITSLFSVSKELLNNIVCIEEAVEKYDEFYTYFKDIPNDDNYLYASNITFPLKLYIHINIYDNYILEGNIEICENEFIFLTGESGSGKSTLAKKIAGYDYYEQNEIIYRKCVFYLTQDYNESWKNSNYTWKDLFPRIESINKLKEYLSFFAFPDHKISSFDTLNTEIPILSGGEKKRLQYAFLFYRDLKENHQLIILDEPHKDLDESTAYKMISGIQKFIQTQHSSKSLIIIKHEKPSTPEFSSWKEWKILSNGNIQNK